jgi:hypothetical protein
VSLPGAYVSEEEIDRMLGWNDRDRAVPRAWLRRAPSRGLWYSRRDLRPGRIRRIWGFHELAD